MPLVYVTGISGAGKSSVLGELRRRGYEALGIDEDGFGRWMDPVTREEVPFPVGIEDPHAWCAMHDWALDVGRIAELKRQVDRDASLMFLCGVASGESEAWEHFDVVCALVIDEATIRARIELRGDDWFGTRPDELERIFVWNEGYAETYEGYGAVVIDATRPLSDVVDDVIASAT
jgi:hypothetical protein